MNVGDVAFALAAGVLLALAVWLGFELSFMLFPPEGMGI
jgi:hypothetical protein